MGIIKVLIAEDHLMVREGIKNLLELDGDIKIVGEADNGQQCLELIKKVNPDIILLDINMPIMNGLEMLKKLREERKKENDKVLILTIHNEIEYLTKAVEIGVNGYVLKDSNSIVLRKAIFAILNGESYIETTLTPLLKERLIKNSEESDSLTRREIEVLKLIAEGLFNKEIASKLSISEKTVKNHVSNIFKKINVADRTQAAVYAIRKNYVAID